MELAELFPSKFMKADADVKEDQPRVLTIRTVTTEEVGQDDEGHPENKPIVYFRETGKGLVLNRTNAGTIAALYGTNTEGWTGKRITVYAADVQFGAKMMRGLRIKTKAPAADAATAADNNQPPF